MKIPEEAETASDVAGVENTEVGAIDADESVIASSLRRALTADNLSRRGGLTTLPRASKLIQSTVDSVHLFSSSFRNAARTTLDGLREGLTGVFL